MVEERNGCARMKKGEFEMDEIVVREISSQKEEEQNNMDWEEESSAGNTWETNNDHKNGGKHMDKKLTKSSNNRMLCGVCAGLAEYFSIDPTVVRLLWVILTFCGGSGILAYIIAAIIIPEE